MSAGEPYTLKLYEAQGMLQVVYTLKLNPLEKKYGVCYLSQTLLHKRRNWGGRGVFAPPTSQLGGGGIAPPTSQPSTYNIDYS